MEDPSIKWEQPVKAGQFPWWWLPVQIVFTLIAEVTSWIVDLIGIIVCIPLTMIYVKTGVWQKWGWLWSSHNGPEPEYWWWVEGGGKRAAGGHWSTRWRGLGIYWWRAIRNRSSNYTRLGTDCDVRDARQTPGSHHGSMNPYYTRMQGKRFAYKVRWDKNRPWLAWFEFSYRWNDTKYCDGKFGFRVAQNFVGLGYTVRIHPWVTFTAG